MDIGKEKASPATNGEGSSNTKRMPPRDSADGHARQAGFAGVAVSEDFEAGVAAEMAAKEREKKRELLRAALLLERERAAASVDDDALLHEVERELDAEADQEEKKSEALKRAALRSAKKAARLAKKEMDREADREIAVAEAGLNFGLKVISASSFKGKPVPKRNWVVEDMIAQGEVNTLNGDGGVGKSLLALQLGKAAVSAGHWIGRQVRFDGEAKPGKVLFLTAEDKIDELHRRLNDMVASDGLDWDELAALDLRAMDGEDAILAQPCREEKGRLVPTHLMEGMQNWIERQGYSLIILDTLANLYAASEIDRSLTMQFITMLASICRRHNTTVILLAHPSQSGMASGVGSSGSTAWNNSVRSRLYMTKETEKQGGGEVDINARYLTTMKSNYSAGAERLRLSWQKGVFVWDEKGSAPVDRMAISAKAERKFMELLRLHNDNGTKVNSSSGPNYAPSVFATHPAAEKVSKDAFRSAMQSLMQRGVVVNLTRRVGGKEVISLFVAESDHEK